MARNRPGGRRGAVRGRTQFRLPNGRFAKVDRATGRILSIKADDRPYKGIVITPAPQAMPRRHTVRPTLPGFPQPRKPESTPGAAIVHLPRQAIDEARQDAA